MPFIESGGVAIHYQVEGDGEALVLLHGFSDSLETWREYGYVDALRGCHQVVLVDARGHGASGKPHDPERYALPLLVGDVTGVLDALGVDRAHVFGVSMGGLYAFGLARYAPHRLRSLLVGAASPRAVPERSASFIAFLQQGAEAFIPVWEAQAPISEALKDRLRANDVEALTAMQRGSRAGKDADLGDALDGFDGPSQLIVGDQDTLAPYEAVAAFAHTLPAGSLVTLVGVNHLESMQRLDLVLPHLQALIASA